MEITDLDQSGMQRTGDRVRTGNATWVTVDEAHIILAGKAGVWEPKARWVLKFLIKSSLSTRFDHNFFMPQLETYPCLTYCQQ